MCDLNANAHTHTHSLKGNIGVQQFNDMLNNRMEKCKQIKAVFLIKYAKDTGFFSVLTKNYYTTDFKMHFPPHQTFETFFLHLFAPRSLVLRLPLPCDASLVHCCTAWQGTSSNLQSANKHKCTGRNGLMRFHVCVHKQVRWNT